MGHPSPKNQVTRALEQVRLSDAEIANLRAETGQVKANLRPPGPVTQAASHIVSYGAHRAYHSAAELFFERARETVGGHHLRDWLRPEVILATFEEHYANASAGYRDKILAALGHVFNGAQQLGWVSGDPPVTGEVRAAVKQLSGEYGFRTARFGYNPGDDWRIIEKLEAEGSRFALPTRLARQCGLREIEVARLKGSNIGENNLTIYGKGGRIRRVPIVPALRAQLNPSAQSVFGVRVIPPWVNAWYREVRRAAEMLGIQVYGIHRFRSNYAQEQHQAFLDAGLTDKEARLQVAELLGHGRVDVTYSYIGKDE